MIVLKRIGAASGVYPFPQRDYEQEVERDDPLFVEELES